MFEFQITARDPKTAARTGRLTTPHGVVRIPVFMPVGTYAAVKTVTSEELRTAGAEIILANTYHLHLRPGEELVRDFGGVQSFMNWHGPMLTDSGGFQVFSLAKMRTMYDDRVEFQSPLDGSRHVFTPRTVVEIQRDLGTDIMMQLDECAPGDADRATAERALDRTMRWAEESVAVWQEIERERVDGPRGSTGTPGVLSGQPQALFPIIQGCSFPDLRVRSAQFAASLPTPGVAIGGLAVGETKEQFIEALDTVAAHLPVDKPHYLMGVGEPWDIVQAVARGVDMFDCVIPTRLARHGAFLTPAGRGNIKKAENRLSKAPLVPNCRCPACQQYSRGYLRHLFVTNEVLGMRLLTLHNLTFLFDLLADIRAHIQAGTMAELVARVGEWRGRGV